MKKSNEYERLNMHKDAPEYLMADLFHGFDEFLKVKGPEICMARGTDNFVHLFFAIWGRLQMGEIEKWTYDDISFLHLCIFRIIGILPISDDTQIFNFR